jgi:hypothetical protein
LFVRTFAIFEREFKGDVTTTALIDGAPFPAAASSGRIADRMLIHTRVDGFRALDPIRASVMDDAHYAYICSLIIDSAAYAIGGSVIHERVITQNLPALQRFYPEQPWTPDRVRRLFETNGLLEAIATNRVQTSPFDGRHRHQSENDEQRAYQIQRLIARIDDIRKRLRAASGSPH